MCACVPLCVCLRTTNRRVWVGKNEGKTFCHLFLFLFHLFFQRHVVLVVRTRTRADEGIRRMSFLERWPNVCTAETASKYQRTQHTDENAPAIWPNSLNKCSIEKKKTVWPSTGKTHHTTDSALVAMNRLIFFVCS